MITEELPNRQLFVNTKNVVSVYAGFNSLSTTLSDYSEKIKMKTKKKTHLIRETQRDGGEPLGYGLDPPPMT